MKPDVDIFRKILIATQTADPENLPIRELEGVDNELFCFHTKLLKERKLIKANILESGYPPEIDCVDILALEWEGHQLLDKIKDDSTWEKVKSSVLKATGTLSLELIMEGVKTIFS